MNFDILGVSELKWTAMGDLTQMTIISTTAGRYPSEEMEWPSWSTKESEMQYLDAIKNDGMISVRFQGKPFQYSCLENAMNSMKRQNDRILKEKLPRSVGAQYAIGDQWRNNPRKNEGMESKQKQYPAVDVTGDRSKD